MSEYCIVYITTPNQETAETIGEKLIAERLAACANLFPILNSLYVWKGKTEKHPEVLMIVKTRTALFPALRDRVQELHPYEVPAIVQVPITDGLPAYLNWLGDSVSAEKGMPPQPGNSSPAPRHGP